jgi:hypothetical protein
MGGCFYANRKNNESRKDWMLDIFKKGGTKQKNKSNNQLWQYNNHAEEVYSPKFTLTKIKYFHNNPVEAGLVSRPEDYFYSSARDYAGMNGPIKVSVIICIICFIDCNKLQHQVTVLTYCITKSRRNPASLKKSPSVGSPGLLF